MLVAGTETHEPRIGRRGFLAGALAATGTTALAPAAQAQPSIGAQQQVVRRGRAIAVSRRGTVVVAHDQRRTIAVGRRLVGVGGQPLEVAISPDGRLAAVTTAFWDGPGLAIVDLRTARVIRRLEVGPAPGGVAFAGRSIVVAGGEQEGGAWIVDARRLRVVAHAPVGICPRAVAAAPGANAAWIALGGEDRVVRVSARTGRVQRAIRTAELPDRLAVSPDGRRLLVAHAGLQSDRVSEIDARTGRITRHECGGLPSAVAFSTGGRPLVALPGEIAVIGGGRRRVGPAPRGLAVRGRVVSTVDGATGEVHRVRA